MGLTFEYLSRRCTLAGKMVQRVLANSVVDLRLFANAWRGGPVLKQSRMNGFQVLTRADVEVGRKIYCHGEYEPEDSRYLQQSIRSNDTCVDVGANVGYYSLLMSAVATGGTVHTFEPIPLAASILRTNLLLNDVTNVVVNQMAVGDEQGEVDFVVSADDAFSSLVDTGRKPVLARTRVNMTTLDHYCETRQIRRIDCLKVDVEGAEEKVIRGAAGILADPERRPRLVMLELQDIMLTKYGANIDQMIVLMRSFGYRPFLIRSGRVTRLTPADYDLCQNVFFSLDEVG